MREWLSERRLPRPLRRALRERRRLQERPWEEDLLHWAKDGSLHGFLVPPLEPEGPLRVLGLVRPSRRLEVARQYLTGPEV